MITSCTFIPSQRTRDLLCALYVEYGFQAHKQRLSETRQFLLDLRAELGSADYALFEKDLVRLMESNCARNAMRKIIRAATLRSEVQHQKQLRTIYQPA